MRNRGAGCSCPSRTCSARCGSCFPATRSSQGARFRRHSGRRVQSSGPRRSEGGWRSEGTSPGRRATRLDTRRCFWPEVGRPPKSVYPFSRPGDRMPPFQGYGSTGIGVQQAVQIRAFAPKRRDPSSTYRPARHGPWHRDITNCDRRRSPVVPAALCTGERKPGLDSRLALRRMIEACFEASARCGSVNGARSGECPG